MVCWCDNRFFRVVFLCGLVLLVLVLPSKGLFFVAANALEASAGFLLGRFFVEVLLIGVKTAVRIGLSKRRRTFWN
ncbi:hypothetical protein F5888DRAFT_1685981 [Russula emetica]|nr:hypothetical protein F5888DRAFT_1685981 [Russula emetica]